MGMYEWSAIALVALSAGVIVGIIIYEVLEARENKKIFDTWLQISDDEGKRPYDWKKDGL